LEILADAPDVDRIVDVISAAANTGKIGDGKIWITDVETVIRVRTGETGPSAI
jgi:nitrogen regulatory protein P-II 1